MDTTKDQAFKEMTDILREYQLRVVELEIELQVALDKLGQYNKRLGAVECASCAKGLLDCACG